jgi:hypothetical protein
MNNLLDTGQKKIKTSKNTYLLQKWGVRKSMQKAPIFAKTLGVSFSHALSKGEDGFLEALPEAIMILFCNLEVEGITLDMFLDQLLEGVFIFPKEGGPRQIDLDNDISEDDLSELMELCSAVFKARYGSLFGKKALAGLTGMAGGMSALQDC